MTFNFDAYNNGIFITSFFSSFVSSHFFFQGNPLLNRNTQQEVSTTSKFEKDSNKEASLFVERKTNADFFLISDFHYHRGLINAIKQS